MAFGTRNSKLQSYFWTKVTICNPIRLSKATLDIKFLAMPHFTCVYPNSDSLPESCLIDKDLVNKRIIHIFIYFQIIQYSRDNSY